MKQGSKGRVTSKSVVINVYDLNENNTLLYSWGLGFYHSGVQIDNEEFTFSTSGVFSHSPKNVPDAPFRESIRIGEYQGTTSDFDNILREMKENFQGSSYNVLSRNCNCFAETFVKKLFKKDIYPAYINRLASIATTFSCCLPPSLLNNAPVNDDTAPLKGNAYDNHNNRPRAVVSKSAFQGSSGRKLGGK